MNIFGTNFDYEARLEKVRKLMDERDVDCVLVHLWPNQYYISGLYQHLPWYPLCQDDTTESPLIVFRDREKPPIFLCSYFTLNATREATWIEDVRAYDNESNLGPIEYVAKVLKENEVATGNIGVEDECLTIKTFKKFQKALPEAQFKEVSSIFQLARTVKEPEEIELIRKAVEIAEAAMKVGMEVAKPGVTEMDVMREVEMEMRRGGSIREVETMCQSGYRTTHLRAWATEWKKIEENDLVMMDLGCIYKGYACDITRTWVVGTPTDEQKKIANDLYQVHEQVLDFIKPRVTHGDVTRYANDLMGRLGYSDDQHKFPHRKYTFHGLGLGPFHDPPDNHHPDTVLEAGMFLSVQPTIRHEKYSIRFEDNVIVTPDGVELVNKLPKELI
ncbi:M24 family metallopeptidase [Nitrospinota bacterium]